MKILRSNMDIRRLLIFLILLACLCWTVQASTLTVIVRDESTDDLISGASVYIDGSYIGKTTSRGEIIYEYMEDDRLPIRVTKSGYSSYHDIIPSDRSRYYVDLSAEEDFLTITVLDYDTAKPVDGALVKITGNSDDDSERSGIDGDTEFSVHISQQYTITISAPKYDTLYKTVTVEKGSNNRIAPLSYWLHRNDQFAFRITDKETGASLTGAHVSVDGNDLGVTDSNGVLTCNLERESEYSLRVEATSYSAFSEEVYVGGDDAQYVVKLEMSSYPMAISVYDQDKKPVDGAQVIVDALSIGLTDIYGRCDLVDLEAGSHSVEVRKDGFVTWTKTLDLTDGGENLAVELEYRKSHATIFVEDSGHQVLPGAVVTVNGVSAGKTNAKGCVETDLPTDGKWVIAASLEGYKSASVEKQIPLGSLQTEAIITLESEFSVLPILGIAGLILILAAGFVIYSNKNPKTKMSSQNSSRRRPPRRSDL